MSNQIRDFCDLAILRASYGLSIGQTIYVRWIVSTEYSDNGAEVVEREEVVWWSGRILMTENEERDSKGRRVYLIRYEERDGFKSDTTRVTIEDRERISHLDYEGICLRYCKTKEEADSIGDSLDQAVEDSVEERTITIQEILEGDILGLSGSDESESGDSGESGTAAGLASVFNSLPHEKKIHLAQGYRRFADMFISFLRSRMSDDQSKNTVTVEDVRDFIASLGLNIGDKENRGASDDGTS
ncbi:hypothetical protein OJ252_1323 [Cryptosporidium canis]|uniref:Uncharacterized protein n=1 Tax=Cryptosporidium canis TaxID=195482 RepID=A0ABQ8PAQ0_9CRYT|nr:hypothetical protein OJ252_1323 [Cryptosporidium canis]